jgi:predicted lipoprotein with Yx(FWY)xxD motif
MASNRAFSGAANRGGLNVTRSSIAIAALALIAVLAIAGCGGSSDSSSSGGAYGSGGGSSTSTSASSKPASAGTTAIVSVSSVPKLGQVIVDSKGFTLYDFHKDNGAKSACYGPCAGIWPPLTTEGAPQAKGGAVASKLGTTKRNDGTVQVTYAGHPLYTYTADTKPGEANGNDFSSYGGEWYALQPNGEEPKD